MKMVKNSKVQLIMVVDDGGNLLELVKATLEQKGLNGVLLG